MSISQNFPATRPSLNLNFARSKKLDSQITFTRSSSGTYVGEDGLIKIASASSPRFDHDPITGNSLGLLVEEQRTNFLLRSEEFNDSYWGKARTTISLTNTTLTTAPDGKFTAEKVIEDSQTGPHHIFRNNIINYTSGQTYTNSVYVKAAERTRISMRLGNNVAFTQGALDAIFDLSNGTIVSAGSNVIPRIQNFGNGWYRCSVTSTATVTANDSHFVLFLVQGNTTVTSYTGDNASGVFVWGSQLELGRFPTSYIPTSGSTVTRTADNVSIVGTNFRKWYNPLESTILSVAKYDGNPLVGVNNAITFFIGGPTGNTWQGWWETPNTGATLNFNGSTFDATIFQSGTTLSIGNTLRMISAIRTNDFAFCRNGGPIQSDTTVSLRTEHNAFFIGSSGGGNYINGRISQIVYYPTRLPNQILQTLTK
jgi:hypothetical protein